jgi:hypothetical protein
MVCFRDFGWGFFPVRQGIQPLLDAVQLYLPSPMDAPPAPGTLLKSGDPVDVSHAYQSLCALVFKVLLCTVLLCTVPRCRCNATVLN